MYKSLAFLYLVLMFCYVLFSRVPDYFEGEFVPGIVTKKSDGEKWVQYGVGKATYRTPIKGWGASQVSVGERVSVVYDPGEPEKAAHYSFFSYWFTLPELLASSIVFMVLFFAAVFITGKEEKQVEESSPRARRYND